MEIRGIELKRKLLETYKNDKDISKLSFYLLRDSKVESKMYFKSIIKVLNDLNIKFIEEETDSFNDAYNKIKNASNSSSITSIIVARPLCKDEQKIFDLIPLEKDVDMLSTVSAGRLFRGDTMFLPATSGACKAIIENLNIDLQGKRAVVIGRSPSVGAPIFWYLQKQNATATLIHSRSKKEDIKKITKESDIVVLASGVCLLEKEDIKDGAIIIDCGYHSDGTGDLNFIPDNADFTPVPGGVGPVTSITLITNALNLYRLRLG